MYAKKQIKAVIFDLDDTLIDWSKATKSWPEISRHHMGNIYTYLAKKAYNLPDRDTFLTIYRDIIIRSWAEAKKTGKSVNFNRALLDTLDSCDITIADGELDMMLQAYDWQPVAGIEPYADTLPVLHSLKEQGYKIGLITNAMQPIWMRDIELRAYGILEYLDARVTSGDVGYIKPHPFIYWQVLETLAVEPQQAVFVGDRPANDIAGANEAGLVSVWINPPHLELELNGVVPDYEVTELAQLLPILNELDKS